MRYFLSRVAEAVRRGEIEIHSYSLLTTHFHMLARSPRGVISEAMRRIQNEYVRYFNRGRRRDGALFRGRFRSLPVDSLAYRCLLVSYIDDNAVSAALAATADAYPWSSAGHFVRGTAPPWLERSWIEEELERGGQSYFETFPSRIDPGFRAWVERRLMRRTGEPDELDNLVYAAPEDIRDWMRRTTALADATLPGQVLLPTNAVTNSLWEWQECWGDWTARMARGRRDAWGVMTPGLLRDGCGLTLKEVALRTGLSRSAVCGRIEAHRDALLRDPHYAKRTAVVLYGALATVKPARPVRHASLAGLVT